MPNSVEKKNGFVPSNKCSHKIVLCMSVHIHKHLGLCTGQARFVTDTCVMVTKPTDVRQNLNSDGHFGRCGFYGPAYVHVRLQTDI